MDEGAGIGFRVTGRGKAMGEYPVQIKLRQRKWSVELIVSAFILWTAYFKEPTLKQTTRGTINYDMPPSFRECTQL